MKKKTIITLVLVVLTCSIFLCSCNMLGDIVGSSSGHNTVTINVTDLENYPSIAKVVAANTINSCVRVITTFANGQSVAGSGFFVTSDGYIVTNRHVAVMFQSSGSDTTSSTIEKPMSSTYQIVFLDNKYVTATLVDYSSSVDLALLKAEPLEEYDPLTIASNDNLFYGDSVFTIGNPDNIGIVFSSGLVASPGIQLKSASPIKSIILDANINHGNSGGPLLDASSHVVGVVFGRVESADVSVNVTYGIGCAVQSNYLISFLDDNSIAYTKYEDTKTETTEDDLTQSNPE